MTARRPRRTSFLSFAALASPVVVTMSVGCKDPTRTNETDYSVCNVVCEVMSSTVTEPGEASSVAPTEEPTSAPGTTGTAGTTEATATTGDTGTDPTGMSSTSSTTGTTGTTGTATTTGETTEDTSTAETTADSSSTTVDTTGETSGTGP